MVVPIISVIGFTTANAATNDPGSEWTLAKLVGYALANNNRLEAAELATKTAAEDINIAEGQRWPQVSALGSVFYTPIRERLLFERHGRRPDNPFQETILNYGVELTLPIYTGGRIRREINIAETGLEAAQSRAAFTGQELVFNVTSAYYTHLRIQYDIAAREALVRSVGESRRIAQEQVSLGRAANLDVLRLDAKLARVESDLAVVRNALANTTITLRVLLTLPPLAPLNIAGELLAAQVSTDLATSQATALSMRQDLAALRREVSSQEERVGIARSLRYPTLGVSAQYGFATGIDETGDDAKLLLRLRLPLYAGGALSARKRKEMARLGELHARLADAERRVVSEVERALIDYSSAQARIMAGWRAIGPADEALRVEREKFQQGRGTSNDLLIAEEAVLAARTQYAAAIAESQIAAVALRLSTGELEAPEE